jgi:hypothetical protein
MKTLALSLVILFVASSCGDVYYVEPAPRYDARNQFIGYYDVNEYSSTYDEYWQYGLTINKSQYDLFIDNFYNSNLRVSATVNGNQLYIPWQVVDGYELQGDGYVEGSKIVINYKVRDTYVSGSAWDFCSATGWR